jgi:uncharacterized protein YndB with AHSA1/START domain
MTSPPGVCDTHNVMPSRQCRQQVLIEAPVGLVWELVGDPNRHAEWWPTVVHSECEELSEGCRYRAVVKSPSGRDEAHMHEVQRLDDCHEVLIRCVEIGTYTRFQLTEAQGGTFVDAEFGIEPQSVGMHVMSVVAGRRTLRRWLDESVQALDRAAVERAQPAGNTPV